MLNDETGPTEGVAATVEMPEAWRVLDLKLRSIPRRRCEIDAEELGYLVDAQATRLYRRFGYVSMLEYMERVLHYGPHAAKERLRVAHELLHLPLLTEELRTAGLCFSAVAHLSRVATAANEAAWIDRARGKTVRQVGRAVAGHKRGADPDDVPDPERVLTKVMFDASPETVTIWRQTRVALEEEHGGGLTDEAFVEMLCRRAMEPSGAAPTRAPVQRGVITCRDCKRGWAVGAGTGGELTPQQLERALCDRDDVGELDSSARTRVKPLVPMTIRRKVMLRDKFGCAVPGCRSTRCLDLHHIVPRSKGGGHQVWNLVSLCSGHHQHHHEGRLSISGRAPDRLTFRFGRDDGTDEVVCAATQRRNQESSPQAAAQGDSTAMSAPPEPRPGIAT